VRRTLLILATLLIVARPLVLGEDPGLLDESSDAGSLLLTLLWLLVAAGWGLWRLLARREEGEPGIWGGRGPGAYVEVGLLVTVGLVFLSGQVAAHYRYPARLIGWEWVGFLVSFFVIRRLAVDRSEQNGLFTALLASAVSVSAYAVWQRSVEIPRLQAKFGGDEQKLLQELRRTNPALRRDDPQVEQVRHRIQDGYVYATFAHPNSFAGYDALCLPGLVAAVVLLARRSAAKWKLVLGACCLALATAGLWFSHSRGAQLALVLVALGAAALAGRRFLASHKGLALTGVVAVLALGYGVYATGLWAAAQGKDPETARQRLYYWQTTVAIIREHPGLGVGPGNFGPAYSRRMVPEAGETIKDPHNFALELAATSGVPTMAVLLLTVVGLFIAMRHSILRPESAEDTQVIAPGRWVYYVGGTFGLVLGFLVRVGDQTQEGLLEEAIAASLRAVVWFAAFGLLEQVSWSYRARAMALTAGVVALLLNLCVSGGISFPSIAGPLWVAAALATAGGKEDVSPPATHHAPLWTWRGLEVIPLPIFAALLLAFYGYVFDPVTTSMGLVRHALDNGQALDTQLAKREGPALRNPVGYALKEVIEPLRKATAINRGDARPYSLLAFWSARLWGMEYMTQPQELPALGRVVKDIVTVAHTAQELDPQGRQGYVAEYEVRQDWFAVIPTGWAKALQEGKQRNLQRAEDYERFAVRQHQLAAEALVRYEPNDPRDPYLRYLIAHALAQAGDKAAAQEQAALALALDAQALNPRMRRLSETQRQELKSLKPAPAS
jgi:O-antigen ligase